MPRGEDLLAPLRASLDWGSLRPVLDDSPTQILVLTGPELYLAYQNGASRRMLGARPVGRPAREAFSEWPRWVAAMEQTAADGRSTTYRQAPLTLHGEGRAEVVLVDAVATPIAGPDGQVVAVVSQAVDVTHGAGSERGLHLALAAARVGAELARSLDVGQVTTAVSRYAAEVFGGWCVLDLYEPDGALARAAFRHHDPAQQAMVDRLRALPRISGRALGRSESLSASTARTGRSALGRFDADAVVAAAASEEQADILRRLSPESYVSVPIQLGPRRLGALTVIRTAGELPFTVADRTVAEQFAERAAIALAHARDYDEQRQAVLALQNALLPAPPDAAVEAVRLAVRYRAAGAGNEVGGDWYDVIPLQGDRLAIVIGDVEGHDLAAAALMSQVRAIVRAFGRSGLPPARVVAEANTFLTDSGSERLVTLAYFELSPLERLLVWVRAGHVPAVVIDGDAMEATVIEGRGGLPLGVERDAVWREETLLLPPRALLATFTDGLVEGPQRSMGEGVDEIAAFLGRRFGDDVETLADELLQRFAGPGDATDDVALVLVRLPEPDEPSGGRVVRRLPPATASATVARHFVRDLLAGWGAEADVIDTAELLTSELMSNAARHTDSGMELRVERLDGTFRVGVWDDSHRLPHPADPAPDAPAGRGLRLVEMLSTGWGVDLEAEGKVVWFTLPLGGA